MSIKGNEKLVQLKAIDIQLQLIEESNKTNIEYEKFAKEVIRYLSETLKDGIEENGELNQEDDQLED